MYVGFAGNNTASLREAIKIRSELTHPPHTLKLIVAGSDETEIDLDDMAHLRGWGRYYNFEKLVTDYKIDRDNPILVKIPGK